MTGVQPTRTGPGAPSVGDIALDVIGRRCGHALCLLSGGLRDDGAVSCLVNSYPSPTLISVLGGRLLGSV